MLSFSNENMHVLHFPNSDYFELFIARLKYGVFGFLTIWASNIDFFVTPCWLICNVFIILATSEDSFHGMLFLSILISLSLGLRAWILVFTISIDL